MNQRLLAKCAAAFLVLPAFLAPLPSRATFNFAQRSVSRSGQFIIYCPDVGLRVAVTGYVETLKTALLEELGTGDHWKLPVVLNLQHPSTATGSAPLCQVRFFNTEDGSKLQVDVTLREDQFREVRFPQQIIRAVLTELAYRDHPPHEGDLLSSPPAWLVEGLAERFQIRATEKERNAALFKQLIDTGRLPKLRDFLKSNVEAMDSTSRAVYAACSASLLDMLEGLPNGKAALTHLVRDFPNAQGDDAGLLVKFYPTLAGGDAAMEKWWTLGLARASATDRYLGLSLSDTDAKLSPLLSLQVVTDEKKGTKSAFAIADYKEYLKFRTAKAALFARGNDFASLQAQAHPLLRPVVLEYQRIVADLARGNTGRIETRLRETTNYRAMIIERMGKIGDYMNWFEATQMPERSGAFDNYLKAARALGNQAPPRREDPMSRYLDQAEREFE